MEQGQAGSSRKGVGGHELAGAGEAPSAAADPAAAFMAAIEADRAASKRLKIEARLRPRPLTQREEFEVEWEAMPYPRSGEKFSLVGAALPFGNSAVIYPYIRERGEPPSVWDTTNYDALDACLRQPQEPDPQPRPCP